MSNPIIDVFTVFGAVPPRTTEPGTAKLVASMDRHGVHRALTISTRGIYHSANAGNRETQANCNQSDGKLKGIATLDPRTTALPSTDGFIALAAFPVAQQWPMYHAAFLVAWFRRVKCRGARVTLLNAAALPMHALRSIWRQRRLRERRAGKSATPEENNSGT